MKLLKRTDVTEDKRCSQCLQWNFEDSGHSSIKYPLPKTHPGNKSVIVSIKLTFNNLTHLIQSSVSDLQSSKINSKEYDSIMKYYGINEKLRIKVIEFSNSHTLDSSVNVYTITPPHWKYKSGSLNETYIDAKIYLVFYGVANESINDTSTFLKHKLTYSSLMRYVNEITS